MTGPRCPATVSALKELKEWMNFPCVNAEVQALILRASLIARDQLRAHCGYTPLAEPGSESDERLAVYDPPRRRGYALALKEAIETPNPVFSLIHHLFVYLVGSGLLNPAQSWYHVSPTPPNPWIQEAVPLSTLRVLAHAVFELVDIGLMTWDVELCEQRQRSILLQQQKKFSSGDLTALGTTQQQKQRTPQRCLTVKNANRPLMHQLQQPPQNSSPDSNASSQDDGSTQLLLSAGSSSPSSLVEQELSYLLPSLAPLHPRSDSYGVAEGDPIDPALWARPPRLCCVESDLPLDQALPLPPFTQEQPVADLACFYLDRTLCIRALHELMVLFFAAIVDPQKGSRSTVNEQHRIFLEEVVRCQILLGTREAVVFAREAVSELIGDLRGPNVCRVLYACLRSPAAPEFLDTAEFLFTRAEVPGEKGDEIKKLQAEVWPALISVRIELKMYTEALALLEKHIASGAVMPDELTPSLIKLGLGAERLDLVQDEIAKESVPRDPQGCIEIIYALARSGRDEDVLRVLDTLQQRPDCDSVEVSNSALEVLTLHFSFDVAAQLFSRMQQAGKTDIVSYNIMISAYARMRPPQIEEAQLLFQELKKEGLQPNSATFTALISMAVASGQMNVAWWFVDCLQETGQQLEPFLACLLVRQLRPSSRARDKQRTLALMDSLDPCEDVVLFSAVVDACARLKDQRRLGQILRKYQKRGLVPNVHSYGTLIKAHGRCHAVGAARELWREMTEVRGLEATSYTYGCMFDTLVSNGLVHEAVDLFFDSQRNPSPETAPNTVQYSILIKGCAEAKDLNTALRLYGDMQSRGVECNEVTFNTLINACMLASEVTRARQVMDNMKNSSNCRPDVVTYSTMIKGLCTHREVDEALELFHEMLETGIKPDAIVFNTLLEGCCNDPDPSRAEQLFKQMLTENVAPSSFTLTALVKLYSRNRQVSKAIELVHSLPKRFHFEADAYVYTALVATCLGEGMIDEALHYFDCVNNRRANVTGRAYRTIALGCVRANRLFSAFVIACDAHAKGLTIDRAVLLRLIHSLTAQKDALVGCIPGDNPEAVFNAVVAWIQCFGEENSQLRKQPPQLPAGTTEIGRVPVHYGPKENSGNSAQAGGRYKRGGCKKFHGEVERQRRTVAM